MLQIVGHGPIGAALANFLGKKGWANLGGFYECRITEWYLRKI
jgi:hypothetical protein